MRGFGPSIMLLACAFTAPSVAAEPFYQDRELKMIVGSGVGGGYDAYARLLTRHWSKYIPGHPAIITQNLPTAASLQAMNVIANTAPRDGATIAAVQNHIAVEPLMGVTGPRENARYDSRKVNWIGSLAREYPVVVISRATKVASFADFRRVSIPVGSTGPATSGAVYARMLNELAGTKFTIIDGYKDNPQLVMAMETGEIGGRVGWFLSSLMTTQKQSVDNGDYRVIAQIALEKHADLPDVPLVTDFIEDPANRAKLEFALSWLPMGRPFVAPPDVPPDRVRELRESFVKASRDPDLLAEAARMNLEISPMSGEEMQSLVVRIHETPASIRDVVRALMVAN